METCRDDEVVDVAGPRLATAMSSWEYLLLRVQQEDEGNSSAPLIPRILNEVTSLMAKVSAVANQYLQPLKNDPDAEAFQLKNQRTAHLIDMQCGTYFISKDDRKILEDHALLDESLTADADATVNSDTVHVTPTFYSSLFTNYRKLLLHQHNIFL